MESIRWPNGPVCPHCGTIGHACHLKPKNDGRKTRTGNISTRKLWKCGSCRKQFSVTIGTCMEGSKIPMRKWVMGYHMLSSAKNGLSSHELGRLLEISHESARFMSHRPRYAFAPDAVRPALTGTVEADETYIGGKIEGAGQGWGTVSKTPVVMLVERDGEARSQVVPDVTAKNIRQILWSNVDPDANLMTDESNAYEEPGKVFASHETVNHSREEYARGNAHVNMAEEYFSQLKRSLDGTHLHLSRKHLRRFTSEFDFRCTYRKITDGERTVKAIRNSAGKRLKYRDSVAKP